MNSNNVQTIFRKLIKNFNTKGYINLNHRFVNTRDELIEIASIFRNPCYETLRIIYMNNNKIVGYESISSHSPNQVEIFTHDNSGRIKAERNFYKINNRMRRLKANGYYMVHNHPSGNARASREDLRTTERFYFNVKGFKGHLIINNESYAWVSINEKGIAISENNKKIKGYKKTKYDKFLKRKSIYDIKITSRKDLIKLMHYIKNSPNFSIAILTDSNGMPRMILDIPNKFFNQSIKQINGYFKNLGKLNGTIRVFIATTDNETYNNALKHFKFGTFTDLICYKEVNNQIFLYEDNEILEQITNNLINGIRIDSKNICVCSQNEKYTRKNEQIRILYKEVGKLPKIKFIDNTLEAKQKLVGGLIEVVPYNDLLIVCNEEGKINNLPPNVVFDYDYIAGNFFVIGDDYKNADFKSLTLEEIEKVRKDLIHKSFKYELQKKKHINNNSHSEKSR